MGIALRDGYSMAADNISKTHCGHQLLNLLMKLYTSIKL